MNRPPYWATSARDYFNYWYGNRSGLGNVNDGDGYRYRGRGPIQLTGRNNYAAAGAALGLDLLATPEIVADRLASPNIGIQTAGWFWDKTRYGPTATTLNALADQRDFESITRAINGGINGLAERLAYYNRALTVLNA